MMTLLVTLSTTHGKYKPLTTTVNIDSILDLKYKRTDVLREAIGKICHKVHTEYWCLKRDGYTQVHTQVLFDKKDKEDG